MENYRVAKTFLYRNYTQQLSDFLEKNTIGYRKEKSSAHVNTCLRYLKTSGLTELTKSNKLMIHLIARVFGNEFMTPSNMLTFLNQVQIPLTIEYPLASSTGPGWESCGLFVLKVLGIIAAWLEQGDPDFPNIAIIENFIPITVEGAPFILNVQVAPIASVDDRPSIEDINFSLGLAHTDVLPTRTVSSVKPSRAQESSTASLNDS